MTRQLPYYFPYSYEKTHTPYFTQENEKFVPLWEKLTVTKQVKKDIASEVPETFAEEKIVETPKVGTVPFVPYTKGATEKYYPVPDLTFNYGKYQPYSSWTGLKTYYPRGEYYYPRHTQYPIYKY